MIYDGPIIDTHKHFWDLSLGRHTWLLSDDDALLSVGDISYLNKSYLPHDYLAESAGLRIENTVHVEAQWDRRRDPVEETQWLESLDVPASLIGRYVCYGKLGFPDTESVLERQAEFGKVVGLRESIRFNLEPRLSWTGAADVNDPLWRKHVSLLRKHDLSLEIVMYPFLASGVVSLAKQNPDQVFIIGHCCSPIDQSEEGLRVWRGALKALSECDNVFIKISNYGRYTSTLAMDGLRSTVMSIVDTFTPERMIYGSDIPVASKFMSLRDTVVMLKEIIESLSPSEQRRIFYENAFRLYKF